ncbi:hypothetical protein XENORESO_005349 [Xenotaenia resolanae]|uniref:Uncharacterized protein n=1 Tax=Xenotaenia resolanae TaxID=208358 RepID=A0ABV0X2Y0_9TELE
MMRQKHPLGTHLRDQFLLGQEDGAILQMLKRVVRLDPDATFSAVQQEALLLEGEQSPRWPEVTCAASPRSQWAWREAFSLCQRTAVAMEDEFKGYVWPARQRGVTNPARSEVVIWGRARTGPAGRDYCGLVETLEGLNTVSVARTLAVIRNASGRSFHVSVEARPEVQTRQVQPASERGDVPLIPGDARCSGTGLLH